MSKLNFAHVFIHYFSNKIRYATKLFVSQPNKHAEERLGTIFGVVEINTPSRENSKIIDTIINEVERRYYLWSEDNLDFEQAFEKTLTEINSLIIELVSKDPVYVAGRLDRSSIREKVNITIGVIKDGKILLAAVNSIGAYLIHKTKQEYKIVEIIPRQQTKILSENIFDSIISGTLPDYDYLFLCNHDVLNFISTERILKTITSLPINKAADYFKNALLQHEGFNFASIIVQSEVTAPERKLLPQSLTSISDLNAGEMATEKLLSPSLLPNVATMTKGLIKKLAGKFKHAPEKPAPKAVERMSHPTSSSSFGFPTKAVENVQLTAIDLELPEGQATVTIGELIKKTQPKQPSKLFTAFDAAKKSARHKMENSFSLTKFRHSLKMSGQNLLVKINKIPNLSKGLLGIFLIVISVFVYMMMAPGLTSANFKKEQMNTELLAVEKLLSEAEGKLIYNEKDQARALLSQAEQTLHAVKVNNNTEQSFATGLAAKMDSLVSKLRNITLIQDPTLLYTLTSATSAASVSAMALFENNLYIFDKANKTVTILNIDSRNIQTATGSFEGNPTKAKANTDQKSVYFITDANKFYRILDTKITAVAMSLPPTDVIADFDFYNDRLYTLIPSKNQIYRHGDTTGIYDGGVTWIRQPDSNISDGNSIKVDKSIWVSTNSGKVIKFFKSAASPYSMQPIEPPLTETSSMSMATDSKNIFLLDKTNSRVLNFDTDGVFLTQYFSPNLNSISTLVMDEGRRVAYVSNGAEIFAMLLPEFKKAE